MKEFALSVNGGEGVMANAHRLGDIWRGNPNDPGLSEWQKIGKLWWERLRNLTGNDTNVDPVRVIAHLSYNTGGLAKLVEENPAFTNTDVMQLERIVMAARTLIGEN